MSKDGFILQTASEFRAPRLLITDYSLLSQITHYSFTTYEIFFLRCSNFNFFVAYFYAFTIHLLATAATKLISRITNHTNTEMSLNPMDPV
jgi:hypothetical protein